MAGVEVRREYRIENIDIVGIRSAGYRAEPGVEIVGLLARKLTVPPEKILVSQSVLVFKDSRELFFASAKTLVEGPNAGMELGSSQGCISLGQQVATFLGTPLKTIG